MLGMAHNSFHARGVADYRQDSRRASRHSVATQRAGAFFLLLSNTAASTVHCARLSRISVKQLRMFGIDLNAPNIGRETNRIPPLFNA